MNKKTNVLLVKMGKKSQKMCNAVNTLKNVRDKSLKPVEEKNCSGEKKRKLLLAESR
jgi:hypothetical protein